jgi:hypothetical protein
MRFSFALTNCRCALIFGKEMNITFNLIAFLLIAPGSSPRLSYGANDAQSPSANSTTLAPSASLTAPSSVSSSASSVASATARTADTLKISSGASVPDELFPQSSRTTAGEKADSTAANGANARLSKGATSLKKARATALSIEVSAPKPEPQRIIGFKPVSENVVVRNTTPGPFKDYADYSKRALSKVDTNMRDYQISGHKDVHVVVTEAYSAALDVKDDGSANVAGDYLERRVCPADIPQLLDAMPDSRYFKRVFISEDLNPEDDYVTQTYYPDGFISSMAMTDGQLELYKAERNEYLRRDVLHEWSHQLRYEFWNDKLRKCFEDAVNLELVEWNPSHYATRGAGEQWAVLGERMLGFGGEEFLEACTKAPIRTTIWMRALQKCLSAVPEPNKSVDHDKYVARMRYVEKHVLPRAMKKLEALQGDGKTEYLREQAKGISQYLDVYDWKRLSRKLALVYCLENYALTRAKASEA